MAIKLTLEVKLDEEVGGPPDAVQRVLDHLQALPTLPTNTFKIVFLAADEAGAELIEDTLDAALEARDYCVVATIDRKYDKRDLKRRRLELAPTPMQRELTLFESDDEELQPAAVRPRRIG